MKASTSHVDASNDPPSSQMMDKFMEKLISMAMPLPSSVSSNNVALDSTIHARIEIQKTRPQLSIPVMSRNSILLLQRLSSPFELIDDCIRLINWVDPLWNITFGLILTLMILKPINIITIPLGYICFQIILPCYSLKKDGNWSDPKPLSEFSREFLLNVTDLQNHMLLYVDTWDYAIKLAKRLVFFKDERLTWVLFVSLLVLIIFLETFGTSILWVLAPVFKLVTLIALWIMLISLHPQLRLKFLNRVHDEELRLRTLSLLNKLDDILIDDVELKFDNHATNNAMELKKFIVFELQIWNSIAETWQFTCFSNDPYPLNSHIRKNKVSFKGAETLASVIPPGGFEWTNSSVKEDDHDSSLIMIDSEMGRIAKDRKRRQRSDSKRKLKPFILDNSSHGVIRDGWSLDMDPEVWVSEDLMNSVVSIDDETKWVYDDVEEGLKIRRRRWVRFAIDENCPDIESEEETEEEEDGEGEETQSDHEQESN